jgi:hypothetical protein
MTDARPVPGDAQLVRLMREASGMGMMDCKAVLGVARRDYGGDLVLALLARDANALAVNIRSRDPVVSDAEARRRWNEGRARGRRADVVARGGAWAELDRLSARSSNDDANL